MDDNAKQIQKLQLMLSGYRNDKAEIDLRLMDARADVTLLEQELAGKNDQLGKLKEELEQAKVQLDLAKNPPAAAKTAAKAG
jgi:chromosome segregation ATPase